MLWRKIYVTGYNQTYLDLHVKFPKNFPDFKYIWSFSTDCLKIPPISNFTKIRPIGVALIHGGQNGGRTDRYAEDDWTYSRLHQSTKKH